MAAMTRSRALILAAIVPVMAVATPVVTWWGVGDLSVRGFGTDLDHAVRPPHWSAAAQTAAGVTALVLLVAGLAVLGVGARRRWFLGQWCLVVALLMAAGALTGWSGRVVTAGVIGANIGVGIAVFFCAPIVLGLILTALVLAIVLAVREWPRAPRAEWASAGG